MLKNYIFLYVVIFLFSLAPVSAQNSSYSNGYGGYGGYPYQNNQSYYGNNSGTGYNPNFNSHGPNAYRNSIFSMFYKTPNQTTEQAIAVSPKDYQILKKLSDSLNQRKDFNLSFDMGKCVYYRDNNNTIALASVYNELLDDYYAMTPILGNDILPVLLKGMLRDNFKYYGDYSYVPIYFHLGEIYKYLASVEPKSPVWVYAQALLSLKNMDYIKAQGQFVQAIALFPPNSPYINKARSYIALAKVKEAEHERQLAIDAEKQRQDAIAANKFLQARGIYPGNSWQPNVGAGVNAQQRQRYQMGLPP